jgi:hypothetical protein
LQLAANFLDYFWRRPDNAEWWADLFLGELFSVRHSGLGTSETRGCTATNQFDGG